MKMPKRRNVALGILLSLVLVGAALMIAQDQETLRIRTSVAATDVHFPLYLARIVGRPLTKGDTYIVHTDGPAAIPAMLSAIDTARERVSFETYVFDKGKVAEQFVVALETAASRGVRVRVVLDSVGAQAMDEAHQRRLEAAGVKVGWFNRLAGPSIEEVNYRTHRKALVVDGTVAFVGGMGVADHWLIDTPEFPRWRDTQVELHGPVAIEVEGAFNENWIETGGVVDPEVEPETPTTEAGESIVVRSSPEGGANGMKLLYLMAIAAARQSIDIQSPYLITDESSRWSLAEARKRGVHVRLLVEGDMTDAKPVKYASRADYEDLLEQGIQIAEYTPTMMHTKATIVDGLLSIVGSANFDNRSLELNDELNVAIFDRAFAARLTADFDRDLGKSRQLMLDEWRQRSFREKGRDWLWSYFGEIF